MATATDAHEQLTTTYHVPTVGAYIARMGLVRRLGIIGAIVVTVTGCGSLGLGASPTPEFCNGIAAETGGCDADLPTYSGTDCEAVGAEFGRQYGERALRIFDGPAVINGNARSSQLANAAVVSVQLANKHLRDNGMVADCDAETFLAAAELTLPAGFRERIGDYLFGETQQSSYEEWREDMLRFLTVIDQGEHLPYAP